MFLDHSLGKSGTRLVHFYFLKFYVIRCIVISRFSPSVIASIFGMVITVLQIAGTCIALCLSSDLKSLSVVTEVSSGGESEVSYFQVSIISIPVSGT